MLNRILSVAMLAAGLSFGQALDGNLTGAVLDPSGAAVGGASVTAENLETGWKSTSGSDSIGVYRFQNLSVGSYKITASATGFQVKTLSSVAVELSKTTTAHVTLSVGAQTESITVTDTPTLIDATTAQISNLFTARMATGLPVASNPTGGYLNLSLLGAGVASSGGVGAGSGPSVGGQRPRNNNFTIEGSDNNRKDITGPLVSIPNDAVREFTVLQNQFSAEFGHSAGGQFNAVILGGSNQLHGKFYEYFQNRNLNAQDEAFKRQGTSQRTRYDQNILGANLGGPLKKDKAFYFGSFDYNPQGRSSTTGAPRYAPTADGYATLAANPSVSQTNLGILSQYLGAAPIQDRNITTNVQGAAIPLGIVPIVAPSYFNAYRGLASLDYNPSSKRPAAWAIRPEPRFGRRYRGADSGVLDAAAHPSLPRFHL